MHSASVSRGEKLYEGQCVPAVSPIWFYLLAVPFVALGAMLAIQFCYLEPVWGNGPIAWGLAATVLGVAAVPFLVGVFFVYKALNYVPTRGIYYYEKGVEYGHAKLRRFVSYDAMEAWELIPFEQLVKGPGQTYNLGRLAISASIGNLSGAAFHLGKVLTGMKRKPEFALVFKVPGQDTFTDGVYKAEAERIERARKSMLIRT